MEPTSPAQYAAFENKTAPALEQVRDGVWSVGLPMPGPYQPHYSLSYLLRDANGDAHVIDTGMDSGDNWDRLAAALDAIGSSPGRVKTVTVTHSHPDHSSLIPRLQQAGATFVMHRREQESAEEARSFDPGRLVNKLSEWGAPREALDRIGEQFTELGHARGVQARLNSDVQVEEDDELPIPGFRLRVLTAAGHTPGSACYIDDEREIVFTGDHLLPNQFPAIGAGGDPEDFSIYGGYLEALARLPERYEALPGHGFRFRGIDNRARQTAEHHLRRTREVAAHLAEDPGLSSWELASRLTWTAGWANLSGHFLYSAVRQTVMHRDYLASGAVIPPAPSTL